MIRCIGNAREGGDGRYYVTCRGSEGHLNPFYNAEDVPYYGGDMDGDENRRIVNDWIAKNCAKPAEVYGQTSVVFESEDDAALFWFTFRHDKPLEQ